MHRLLTRKPKVYSRAFGFLICRRYTEKQIITTAEDIELFRRVVVSEKRAETAGRKNGKF